MSADISVASVHGIAITYNPEKKQFLARVGGRDIKKSSQHAVEKVISKFVRGGERVKGVILHYGWRTVTVKPIEIVGLRGSKVQYKAGEYLESEDADSVYAHDEKLVTEAKALDKEHDNWLARWESLVKKAKHIDPESLR
jgi:FtsZ-binding cell division protein ZapB